MPVYEYVCPNAACKTKKQMFRPVDERDLPTKCKVCETEMTRTHAIGGVSFKGKGWAKDGYSS